MHIYVLLEGDLMRVEPTWQLIGLALHQPVERRTKGDALCGL